MFCFHDGLKQFKFSDEQFIKLCPYCTSFDTHRVEVLYTKQATPWPVDASAVQHWGAILDDDGLSMSSGLHEWLMFESDIASLQPDRQLTKRTYNMVDDNDWDAKQKFFPHGFVMNKPKTNFCPECKEYVNQNHEHSS